MKLEGRVAIVTGAGGGFGEAIARRFAAEGARVAVVDLDGAAAARVAGALGNGAFAVQADVGDAAAVHRAVAEVAQRLGPPAILVNNAGVVHRNRPLLEVEEAEFDRLFRVNVKSIFLFVREAAPLMRDAGGGVVLNLGSTAGSRPRPGLTWYNASKGAVILASKSLAAELAPWRIRVNCISPVMGETAMLPIAMGGEDTPEARARFVSSIPLGRFAQPADIAAAALFLASDEAGFVTGIDMPVDGGRTV